MHRYWRPHDLAAQYLANCLMAEANAKRRNGRRRLADELKANAGVIRCARTRREHDCLGISGHHVISADLIIAMNDDGCAQSAEVVEQVESEAVVVVDEDYHSRTTCFCAVAHLALPRVGWH